MIQARLLWHRIGRGDQQPRQTASLCLGHRRVTSSGTLLTTRSTTSPHGSGQQVPGLLFAHTVADDDVPSQVFDQAVHFATERACCQAHVHLAVAEKRLDVAIGTTADLTNVTCRGWEYGVSRSSA